VGRRREKTFGIRVKERIADKCIEIVKMVLEFNKTQMWFSVEFKTALIEFKNR